MGSAVHAIPLEAEVKALYPQIPQNESESSFTSYPASS
jgi:hypothetical protein